MRKKTIIILLVAFFLLNGVAYLFADQENASAGENMACEAIEPSPPDSPSILCGEGNGGGGNPG